MIKPISILLAGATLLSGCNLAPAFVQPTGVVPAALPQGGVYPDAVASPIVVADLGWQDFFTDARLRSVIAQGLDNNRDLRVAAANVVAARAQYRVTRADRLPTASLSGSATYTDNASQVAAAGSAVGSEVESYSADLGVSAFEIDLFGRVRNQSEAALQQYFATEEGQRSTRISLIAEIATAWLTLAGDQDQLRLSRQTLASYQETLSLTQAQFRLGTASELEARQADVQYQAARNDVAVLETTVARDRNALDLLVGAPVAAEFLPQGLSEVGATLAELPTGVSSEVLLTRPDVLQAERKLRAENADIGAARAALFPTISLTASYGSASSALSDLFTDGSYSHTITPALSLPIFDAGRRMGNVRLAQANADAAVATYEKAIQTAFSEVADALAQRGTINEQVSAQTARAGSARAAATISEARYRVGVSSFLVALDAQRTAYSADQQLLTTRLSRETNLVELYRTLGGGLR
ncbi:efflux transporter outer membrane subunit [Brevundimonas sp. SL130]|uniref:efflux transporter outer membrane subunit n=1 Tax=Brevundimonas sp. SL130 TaxID=2995143 RepID=UPI00226D039C|nr:efflux transporter outer membrane subunit [Brevundimonas sp. SL130]WAC59609.1 efflux transporter outer membrane subunit [Brevundimonas sp. SL130]